MTPSVAPSETPIKPGVPLPQGDAPGSIDIRPTRTRTMPVDIAVNKLKTAIYEYTQFMALIDTSQMNLQDYRSLTFRSKTSFAAINSQFQALSKILAKNGFTEERKNLERDVTDCRVLHWNLELHPRGKSLQSAPLVNHETSSYHQPTKVLNPESAFIEYQDTPPKSARSEPQPIQFVQREDHSFQRTQSAASITSIPDQPIDYESEEHRQMVVAQKIRDRLALLDEINADITRNKSSSNIPPNPLRRDKVQAWVEDLSNIEGTLIESRGPLISSTKNDAPHNEDDALSLGEDHRSFSQKTSRRSTPSAQGIHPGPFNTLNKTPTEIHYSRSLHQFPPVSVSPPQQITETFHTAAQSPRVLPVTANPSLHLRPTPHRDITHKEAEFDAISFTSASRREPISDPLCATNFYTENTTDPRFQTTSERLECPETPFFTPRTHRGTTNNYPLNGNGTAGAASKTDFGPQSEYITPHTLRPHHSCEPVTRVQSPSRLDHVSMRRALGAERQPKQFTQTHQLTHYQRRAARLAEEIQCLVRDLDELSVSLELDPRGTASHKPNAQNRDLTKDLDELSTSLELNPRNTTLHKPRFQNRVMNSFHNVRFQNRDLSKELDELSASFELEPRNIASYKPKFQNRDLTKDLDELSASLELEPRSTAFHKPKYQNRDLSNVLDEHSVPLHPNPRNATFHRPSSQSQPLSLGGRPCLNGKESRPADYGRPQHLVHPSTKGSLSEVSFQGNHCQERHRPESESPFRRNPSGSLDKNENLSTLHTGRPARPGSTSENPSNTRVLALKEDRDETRCQEFGGKPNPRRDRSTSRERSYLFRLGELLKAPATPFRGEPERFSRWYYPLLMKLEKINADPSDAIDVLEAHTAGKPLELVRTLSTSTRIPPATMFENIKFKLKQRFGADATLAISLHDRLCSMRKISGDSRLVAERMTEFSDLCTTVLNLMGENSELSGLDTTLGLDPIRKIIPDYLSTRWTTAKALFLQRNPSYSHPPFEVFCTFVENESIALNGDLIPVSSLGPSSSGRGIPNLPRSRAMKTEQPKGKFSCILHPKDATHDTSGCTELSNLDTYKRKQIIIGNGLCQKCLRQHDTRTCEVPVRCEICLRRSHCSVSHFHFPYTRRSTNTQPPRNPNPHQPQHQSSTHPPPPLSSVFQFPPPPIAEHRPDAGKVL